MTLASAAEAVVDIEGDGIQLNPIEMRYAWPAELDLMARLAGMRLEHRWAGWGGEPFTSFEHLARVGLRAP